MSSSPKVALPPPDGPLSCEVPSTAITAVNKEVEKIVIKGSTTKKRLLPEVHTKAESLNRELRID